MSSDITRSARMRAERQKRRSSRGIRSLIRRPWFLPLVALLLVCMFMAFKAGGTSIPKPGSSVVTTVTTKP